MNECQGNFEIRIIELEQKVAKIEKWQEKILKHESLVSDGTVDAVAFKNNMLKAENAKLKQKLEKYKNLVRIINRQTIPFTFDWGWLKHKTIGDEDE